MLDKNQLKFVKNEQNILKELSDDYVVRCLYTFQSPKYLYFVMEYMIGGDMGALLEGVGAFEEDAARIYLAELVLAIQYLHNNNVIHRDLKPDNILIDSKVYIYIYVYRGISN